MEKVEETCQDKQEKTKQNNRGAGGRWRCRLWGICSVTINPRVAHVPYPVLVFHEAYWCQTVFFFCAPRSAMTPGPLHESWRKRAP